MINEYEKHVRGQIRHCQDTVCPTPSRSCHMLHDANKGTLTVLAKRTAMSCGPVPPPPPPPPPHRALTPSPSPAPPPPPTPRMTKHVMFGVTPASPIAVVCLSSLRARPHKMTRKSVPRLQVSIGGICVTGCSCCLWTPSLA